MQSSPSGQTKSSTLATGEWAAYCKTCGTIEQYDIDDLLKCCINDYGEILDCATDGDHCVDHPREYYIYCQNMHPLLLGSTSEMFFHGTMRALKIFCGYCQNNECKCVKRQLK